MKHLYQIGQAGKIFLLALFAVGFLTACSDDDDYQAGPAAPDNCMTVYFDSSNDFDFLLTPDELAANPSITLSVSRLQSDNAAVVPIIVQSVNGNFEFPASVEFAAGQTTSQTVVSFPNIEYYKTFSFAIRIADEYANPYAIVDGSDVYQASVLISEWEKVIENAQFYFYDQLSIGMGKVYSDIYHLKGLNKFYVENFVGSGIDLQFKVSNGSYNDEDRATWKGEFVPLSNYEYEEDLDEYPWWWLLDDAGDYAAWTPEGATTDIEYVYFYMGSDYAYIDLNNDGTDENDYAGWLNPYLYLVNGSEGYDFIEISWKPENIVNSAE